MTHAIRTLPLILAPLLVVACGGGGSSGGDTAGPRLPAPTPAGTNQAPTAAFTLDPQNGRAPLEVDFDASASSDADGTVNRYDWDFGDGATATGVTVQHSYARPGAYTARLQVTDDDGAVSAAVADVDVSGFTVKGVIRAQAASAIDSDTNDVFATQAPNDSFAGAQFIPNPATVGGYMAAPGAGPDGAVSGAGDVVDIYRFEALGGESIVLSIASDRQDLDLRLFRDPAAAPVDESLDVVSPEIVRVPDGEPGTYFIEVSTFLDAASKYVLNIGQFETAGLGRDWTSDATFVPGEWIAGPRRHAAGSAARAGAAGRGGRRVQLRDDYRSRLRPATSAVGRDAARGARERTLSAIKEAHARGEYAWVEPNWLRRPLLEPNDQFFANQWHYDAIRLPEAWELTTGDPDVIVAVIDSGILLDHPEFEGQLVPGFDFVADVSNSGDGDGRDPDPTDPGGNELGSSSTFHGSHVAGTVAARTDNGAGVAGAGWNVRVMPLRALGEETGTSFDVRQAMLFAAGLPNASGTLPAQPADIVNLSLGGSGFSQADQDVVAQLRDAGVIVIASAGNENTSSPSFPAAYDGVVSVAATTITNNRASYSNFGSSIDVAAPGGDLATDVNGDGIGDGVISTVGDDSDGNPATPPVPRLGALAGTSMAAPHVAAVAALMRSVYPALTPAEFDDLLASGVLTEDLGAPGRDDRFGSGLIDAQQAVVVALERASGATGVPGILAASPRTLNFGAFGEQLELRLTNAGNGALSVIDVSTSAPWLAIASLEIDAAGLGSYAVSVERDLLPSDGLFDAEVVVTSDANAVSVTVLVQRASEDLSADTGNTFVILADPDPAPGAEFPAEVVQARSGIYSFEFTDVAPGVYRLQAGSDSDNDRFICDEGESCGIFPTLDAPTDIRVDGDIEDLEFVSSFLTSIAIDGASRTSGAGEVEATDAAREGAPTPLRYGIETIPAP